MYYENIDLIYIKRQLNILYFMRRLIVEMDQTMVFKIEPNLY